MSIVTYLKYFQAIITLVVLSGCAELSVRVPNPRIESPEMRGNEGMTLQIAGVGAHDYEATSNAGARPPDLSDPHSDSNGVLVPAFRYAFIDRLEAGAEWNVMGGLGLVAKYQLLGSGTREATEGNFAVSGYARIGTSSGSGKGDQATTFGPGGYHWKGTVSATYTQVGVSAGYRVLNHLLLYAGAGMGQYTYSTVINQDPSATDPGGEYKARDKGRGSSLGGGLILAYPDFQIFAGYDYTSLSFDRADGLDDYQIQGGLTITPPGTKR